MSPRKRNAGAVLFVRVALTFAFGIGAVLAVAIFDSGVLAVVLLVLAVVVAPREMTRGLAGEWGSGGPTGV